MVDDEFIGTLQRRVKDMTTKAILNTRWEAKGVGFSSNGKKLANLFLQKVCKTVFTYQNSHFSALKINQNKQLIQTY
jgi:hypothetical protein